VSESHGNAEQVAYWNGPEGQHWADREARFDAMLAPFLAPVLDAAGVAEGTRVLDVGCGNGALSRAAAARGGTVTGVDISAPMLERARARAAAEGLDVDFLEADAQVHRFAGGVDRVVSRFGVMFFADPVAAFANLATALAPGGRVAFVCWQGQPVNEWVAVPALAMLPIVGPPDMPPADAPGPFAFADADRVTGILSAAGLTDVDCESITPSVLLGGGLGLDDTVGWLAEGGMGKRFLAGADGPTTERALDAVREALAPYVTPAGVEMATAGWLVTATRP
jgi:SAM-dependent methyltransferase